MKRRRGFLCWLLGCRWDVVWPETITIVPVVRCERCGRTENP